MDRGPDPRRSAGEAVLAQLLAEGTGDDEAAEVVRDGAALLLLRGRALVRVRLVEDSAVAYREVEFAVALEKLGVPVTTLLSPDDQPWILGGCVVTAWRWSEGGGPVTDSDLGRLARTLRERTAEAVGTVPTFDPIEAVLGAVAHLPTDDGEAAFVRLRAAELATAWADAAGADPLGRAFVHGDLHIGNVVAGRAGPMLTDLELMGAGPPSYDAAPAVVAVVRYGADPAGLDSFMVGFGEDPRRWAGFATFVAVYELWVTAWAIGVRHQDSTWAEEAAVRVATLRDGSDQTWTLR